MKINLAVRAPCQVSTLICLGERAVRLVQLRHAADGPRLLALKVRPADSLASGALHSIVRSLPAPVGRVVLVLPKSWTVTRHVTLPTDDPGELTTMARYAVAEGLPYPVEDCVLAVHPLRTADKKTTALVIVAPRDVLYGALERCRQAGLRPSAIALGAEGMVRWHARLVPALEGGVRVSLDVIDETLEIAIAEGEHLLAFRSVPLPQSDRPVATWLVEHVRETVRQYERELMGPPLRAVVVGTHLLNQQGITAALSEHLGLPVHVAEISAAGLATEVTESAEQLADTAWSDLLGFALAPLAPTLDLLPAEVRHAQAREAIHRLGWRVAAWCGVCVWLGAAVAGATGGRAMRELRRVERQQESRTAVAARLRTRASHLEIVGHRQHAYAEWVGLINALQTGLPAGVTVERLACDRQVLTVHGSAVAFSDVTGVVEGMSRLPGVRDVALHKATTERDGRIRFVVEGEIQ